MEINLLKLKPFIFFLAMSGLLFAFFSSGLSQEALDSAAVADSFKLRRDALIDSIEQKVNSTLLNGGSSPIGFSGEGRLRIQFHSMNDCSLMNGNRSWIQSGWEGNQGLLRLGMTINLGRNANIYSKIGFQHTLPGNHVNNYYHDTNYAASPGYTQVPIRHDKVNEPAYIHEDLFAGLSLRAKPVSFKLNFGGIQWIEASPLTIWKYQQRMFAWEYLPFEIEESVWEYYNKNMINGERTERAAWNKRPFYGIGLDSIVLPGNFFSAFFYGSFDIFDKHEREYVHLQDDRSYFPIYPKTPANGRGIGDSYRHMLYGRLAKENAVGKLTPGVNFVTLFYDRDIITDSLFCLQFTGKSFHNVNNDSAFYKEPWILSADLRGKMADSLSILVDIACSRVDTAFIKYPQYPLYPRDSTKPGTSPVRPAIFARINSTDFIPIRLDLFYAAPGFYSPFSFAKSVDAFFPFGANLIGPGEQFVASAYTQNMAGFNCCISPVRMSNTGHFRITYGNHLQLEKGPDVIFFPYRLNGADLFTVFQTPYSRWGFLLLDFSLSNQKYSKRLGDESYRLPPIGSNSPAGPEGGGIRSHDLSMYEGFVPYESKDSAERNFNDRSATIFHRSLTVPFHRKYTFNLELDAAYDIAPLFNWKNNIFLSVYAALNGISRSLQPMIINKKSDKALLWGCYFRFEPAIALSERLYLLGLAGFENWYSGKAWMADTVSPTTNPPSPVPIDYRDFAYGLGCDWEMLERVGLHLRFKQMGHVDFHYPRNNWKTPIVSMEMKMWF